MTVKEYRSEVFELPESPDQDSPVRTKQKGSLYSTYFIVFLILFCIWIIFSGKFDIFHLSLGIASSVIVTLFSGDLLLPELTARGLPASWWRFGKYIPWLIWKIFLANLHILYLVFHPRMKDLIDPKIIRFYTGLRKDFSLVTLANSITLTPGTITVSVSVEGEFSVHAIDQKSAEALPRGMEERVARAFGEGA